MHPRFAPYLFSLFLSGFMSFIVSGIATVRAAGLVPHLPWVWLEAWLTSWAVACPVVFVVAPMVRRLVASMVRQETGR
ncbi:DUF2798 domain-containing protein [Acuticoccus sp. I52.16.1]|uniref:DUF2798 domain-containing protein n=1 Tax=Acuticoccus sp. I52.16.1 TaxID=2928472 RepID=UPI001FD3B417|nr:DUF2798 domain-containing protein [Acuticoccus sp. I52.16.1]UOM36801.1 DUF2798 domain-containing protein [Acuticoccus sp. I52.16.1]